MQEKPSVLLVEDQKLLRVSLKVSLESLGLCSVTGEATNGEEAVKEANRLRPDVILMDLGLPKVDGVEATWLIKQDLPRTRVVMLTSRTDGPSVSSAFGAGADAYCTKDTPIERVGDAIHAVLRGETWLDPAIADAVILHQVEDENVELTTRELEILKHIRDDLRNNEIASKLGVSEESIARILHSMLTKFMQKREEETSAEKGSERELRRLQEWLTAIEPELAEGEIFEEKYKIESCIGSGGIGSVYKAKHMFMERTVALKMLRAETAEDRLALRCFQREATAIAAVQHPNIVSVYDFGISKSGEPYLLMEYIEGVDLADLLHKHGRLLFSHFIPLALQVCDGLEAAHSRGIIHCDLKPSNILITGAFPAEVVKLVDFGLVQMAPQDPNPQMQVTQKNFVCGTPSYMPPEQCIGKPADARTDIYALGCIIYEALSGVTAFVGDSPMEIFAKQIESTAPVLSSVCPEGCFPPGLDQLVSSMLAKNPDERPQNLRDVKMQLRKLGNR
jgi:DNA-binding NarL/FixJ family response regulator/tRNA A-37 threonylcarbamoyl transferase component Bud32